ncbi:MAG: TldD/PmbA family protein [bacterium]|nr:TldD/PmbA family protein [bacterium]
MENLPAAIDRLKKLGADYADARSVETKREDVVLRNGKVEAVNRSVDSGVGIRVIADGSWGFAAVASGDEADIVAAAEEAFNIAKASATTKRKHVKLGEIEIYQDTYETPIEKDPFEVPLRDKIQLLTKAANILHKSDKIVATEASCGALHINKRFVSTEGADIRQHTIETGAGIEATAKLGEEIQKRTYPNSFRGDWQTRGWESVDEMKLVENADRVRDEAILLLTAEVCPAGKRDIIISGPQLALQVHESNGHPTELDRVLGTEISLAGGSFMQPHLVGNLKYGSDIVNIYADSISPGGLGTFGYDDEGVKSTRTDIIKNGIFVGYLSSRECQALTGHRANGAMRADGWSNMPLIRMINHSLAPGDWELDDLIADSDGALYMDMNKSWSIDDRRVNFKFGCEIAWEIQNGKLAKPFKNPAYTGITPEFWNSCDAICNEKYWHIWGIPSCGKGEPMQSAHVAHGTSPARFRKVSVGGAS